MQRKIRVLVGKPGLDGHDRGAKVVAAALRDAGMEVIYTGLHQMPEQIIEAAIQEDVDVVALSILSGAHMTLFPEIRGLMEQRGIGDKLLTGGGIIPADDMETLAASGVGRLFGPGASTQDIARYIREWFMSRHGADSLAPMPAPPASTLPVQGDLWSATSPAPGQPTRSRAPASPAHRAGSTPRKPAAKKPTAKKSVAKKPAAKRPAVKTSSGKKPATRGKTAAKKKAPARTAARSKPAARGRTSPKRKAASRGSKRARR
jgi:methylmalonyl-CoA mutase, C-terminal domain